jgi:hypothetical protein
MPLIPKTLHVNRPTQPVAITADEAALLVALLRPRANLLIELLDVQIQACPVGDESWGDTADALATANGVMIKLRNAQLTLEGGPGHG